MASNPAEFTKDPDAVLDYTTDWSAWLTAGDTISSCEVIPTSGITVNSTSFTATTITAWVQGGSGGTVYSLTFRAITTNGRTDDRTITLRCQQR